MTFRASQHGNGSLSSGAAEVYADGGWARTNATLVDGNNSYTATATEHSWLHGRTAQDSVSVNLPATVNFQYDRNGNLTHDGQRVFDYDDENQLTAVLVSNVKGSVNSIDNSAGV